MIIHISYLFWFFWPTWVFFSGVFAPGSSFSLWFSFPSLEQAVSRRFKLSLLLSCKLSFDLTRSESYLGAITYEVLVQHIMKGDLSHASASFLHQWWDYRVLDIFGSISLLQLSPFSPTLILQGWHGWGRWGNSKQGMLEEVWAFLWHWPTSIWLGDLQ